MNVISKNFTCNESIRERELRVIDSDGSQLGVISRNEALQIAEEKELDLVMISPTAVPPVCKIMDLGKYIYEQSKKEKEAKKKQKVTVIKEIRCSLTIEENDIVPPVCKIMDLGKYIYEQSKKEKEAKKKQKVTVIKEIRCSLTIEENDIAIKAKNARKFLLDGDKVKVTVRFKGREATLGHLGLKILENFVSKLEDVCTVEKAAKQEGRNMTMVLAPKKA